MSSDSARNPDIELVENSFLPLVPNRGLDAYKRHMGFTVEPYHMAMYFHPWLAPLVTSRPAVAAARAAWALRPKVHRLELAAKLLEGARTTTTTDLNTIRTRS